MSKNKEPSCKLNKLLVCSNHTECKRCGWYAGEIRRRKELLNTNGLKVGKNGKKFLSLRKGDAE